LEEFLMGIRAWVQTGFGGGEAAMNIHILRGVVFGVLIGLSLVTPYGPLQSVSEAATVGRVTPSGDGIELEYTDENGTSLKDTIPIHRAGTIRYFSAGIGLAEREAKYPPFPLKLIFVAGPRAYTAQVAVTIADAKGAVVLQVPREQVTGPWLFVDLPAGTYDITADRSDYPPAKQRVEIASGRVKTVYLRWKE
jgi:hypothetical protein